MGSSYLPPPEQNVVNVGDEISASALAALQAASPSLSQANPVASEDYVDAAIGGIEPSGAGKIADYDNGKTYAAGDQVVFNDRLYKFKAFIGAAGYAPDTHPAAWTELSAGIQTSSVRYESSRANAHHVLLTECEVFTSGMGAFSQTGLSAITPNTRRLIAPSSSTGYASFTYNATMLAVGCPIVPGTLLNNLDQPRLDWSKEIRLSAIVKHYGASTSVDANSHFWLGLSSKHNTAFILSSTYYFDGFGSIGITRIGSGPINLVYKDNTVSGSLHQSDLLNRGNQIRTIPTSFTPVDGRSVEYQIHSNGNGVVRLYANGIELVAVYNAYASLPPTVEGAVIHAGVVNTATMTGMRAACYVSNLKVTYA
jgi:hypothetical protein